MQDWSHIIYSLFNGGATQATKIYSKVHSQYLHWGNVENYKKNLTGVCFPANILYNISQTDVTICHNLQRLKYIIAHSVQVIGLHQFSLYSN